MAGMAATPHPNLPVDDVLEALRNGEMSPSELITTLTRRDISDAAIRMAIWYLISQNQLELSEDQQLRLIHAAA